MKGARRKRIPQRGLVTRSLRDESDSDFVASANPVIFCARRRSEDGIGSALEFYCCPKLTGWVSTGTWRTPGGLAGAVVVAAGMGVRRCTRTLSSLRG